MEEAEIIRKIEEFFEDNYEMMRLEGGHSITEDIKQVALMQVRFYYQKMKETANRVTNTEMKLALPDQKTPKGRRFNIEGVVDIVRQDEETWMYDIKTHDPEYIAANKSLYEQQLNVYAHIWQALRGEKLDQTAIISTAFPQTLKQAYRVNDPLRIQYEMDQWQPLITIPFQQEKVEETVQEFARVVDAIEDKQFHPAPLEVLQARMTGSNSLFATRICRNCDARFSCASYRAYATGTGKGEKGSFRKYFEDFGSDADQEEWVNANLDSQKLNI